MSLINIVPVLDTVETKEIHYLGGTILIPASHNWMAVVVNKSFGNSKRTIVSFVEKPVENKSGNLVPAQGTEYQMHCDVVCDAEPADTLRKVSPESSDEVIAHNIEELTYKLQALVSKDLSADELVHAVLCPNHGVLTDFVDHLGTVDESEETEKDPEPITKAKVSSAAISAINLGDIPPGLAAALSKLLS